MGTLREVQLMITVLNRTGLKRGKESEAVRDNAQAIQHEEDQKFFLKRGAELASFTQRLTDLLQGFPFKLLVCGFVFRRRQQTFDVAQNFFSLGLIQRVK
jgi:hypothetical protein